MPALEMKADIQFAPQLSRTELVKSSQSQWLWGPLDSDHSIATAIVGG